MKYLLKQKQGAVAIAACLFSVSAVHAQMFTMYNAQTGALISQSSLPTLSGGAWNGQALPTGNVLDVWTSSGVAAVLLMDPDGSLSSYRMDTGALISDPTATTFSNGPRAGQTLAANRNNIIGAITGGGAVLGILDPDGSTSHYNGTTLNVTFNSFPTTLTNGPHAGETFSSTLTLNIGEAGSGLIGLDALLDSDGSISLYGVTGAVASDPTATTFTWGYLDGQSLASVLGKPGTSTQPGVTYLGIDTLGGNDYFAFITPVPEPRTIALLSVGGLVAGYHLIRRRK